MVDTIGEQALQILPSLLLRSRPPSPACIRHFSSRVLRSTVEEDPRHVLYLSRGRGRSGLSPVDAAVADPALGAMAATLLRKSRAASPLIGGIARTVS